MTDFPTDEECSVIEQWGRRQGAVPSFREASAADDAIGRVGAVKALRALGDAVEIIG